MRFCPFAGLEGKQKDVAPYLARLYDAASVGWVEGRNPPFIKQAWVGASLQPTISQIILNGGCSETLRALRWLIPNEK